MMSGTITLPLHGVSPHPASASGSPTMTERALLLDLQRRALQYFVDNQAPSGLILDRQSNRGRLRTRGLCSTSATGMGLIALALAASDSHRLLRREEAIRRILRALAGAAALPHHEGVVPHFVDASTGRPRGVDTLSTIDTGWLLAGALWAASALGDAEIEARAMALYERVDWRHWSARLDDPSAENLGEGLLLHGRDRWGRFLVSRWDRLNGETIFLYVLAAGAEPARSLPASAWSALRPFYGQVAGHQFNNADLGLFVFQYGLDLLDLKRWRAPGGVDLASEAAVAAAANRDACREAASTYATYQRYWGLSAGDGPGEPPTRDCYRAYSPSGPVDGTAHLTAALASVAHQPESVFANLHAARAERSLPLDPRGRYGLANVNLDRGWVGHDMVGIDAGAAVLALENVLAADRVRAVFHNLPCIRRGLARLGFVETPERMAS